MSATTIGTARIHNLGVNTTAEPALGTTPQAFSVIGAALPGTLWVRPAGGTWTVEYSVDNGANYLSLTALTGATGYKEVQITAGFTNLRITSTTNSGGTWGIA